MPIASFSLVALDCPDPQSLAEFYQHICGGSITALAEDDEWVQLDIPGSSSIAFQRDDNFQAPSWPDGSPQQAHLDFDVADLDEGERQLLEVGARKSDFQPRSDSWRVFLDPAGHPFCLVKV